MKIVLWIIGIVVLIGIIPVVITFANLIFRSELTELKVKKSPEYRPLIDNVIVEEIESDELPLTAEIPNTGDLEAGYEMLLMDDNVVKEGHRVFDDDPGKEVIVAFNKFRQESLVFTGNDIFALNNEHKGNKIGSFPSPQFSYVDYVLPVNGKFMLIDGAMPASAYPSERELWQVEYNGLNKTRLSNDPYYTSTRPPKVFIFKDASEELVVYYTGSFDYAFGGDSSRPEYSVLRVYNAQHPEGLDIVKFGFKAGTIVDVKKMEGGYLVTGDPSRPAMADMPRLSPRIWKVSMNGGLVN